MYRYFFGNCIYWDVPNIFDVSASNAAPVFRLCFELLYYKLIDFKNYIFWKKMSAFLYIFRHSVLLPCPTISLAKMKSIWYQVAQGDARAAKWRGKWRMQWVARTLHTTSENGVSSISTADAHSSVASSRLNWRLRQFKWTPPFRRKTKSVFCTCAITFQTQSTTQTVTAVYLQRVSFRLLLCFLFAYNTSSESQ